MDIRGGETPPGNGRTYLRKDGSSTESKNLSRGVLLLLVGLGLAGVFMLLRPFIAPIVLAVFLVTIFHPVYVRLLILFRQKRTIASAAAVAGIFVAVVIPFLLFTAAIVQQGLGVAERLQAWLEQGGPGNLLENIERLNLEERPYFAFLSEFISEYAEEGSLTERLTGLSRDIVQSLGNFILPLISQTGFLLMNFFIMFFIMFYAFRDGDKMLDYFFRILPLSSSHEKLLIQRVRYIARAVLLGMLLTAVIQAAVAMIGFKIIGIPALFWGVMLGISSFIPLVGTALVWVPVTAYMLISGEIGYAVFIFIWCAGGVGSIDNFLRPYLMQGKSGMSTLILFFALIGGIRLFGPVGILYGPMIFGLLAVMLYIYTLQHSRALDQLDRQ